MGPTFHRLIQRDLKTVLTYYEEEVGAELPHWIGPAIRVASRVLGPFRAYCRSHEAAASTPRNRTRLFSEYQLGRNGFGRLGRSGRIPSG